MQWLKHAFAVEPEGPAEPTDAERAIADRICREVVRRRMATPALMFLEMCRPLNYLGSQAMHFFGPIATVLVDKEGYRAFAAFLERRGSMDYLCHKIEAFEAETHRSGEQGPDSSHHDEPAADAESDSDSAASPADPS